jgi:hypothetical protein
MESAPRVPSIGRLETTVTYFSPNPDDRIVLSTVLLDPGDRLDNLAGESHFRS